MSGKIMARTSIQARASRLQPNRQAIQASAAGTRVTAHKATINAAHSTAQGNGAQGNGAMGIGAMGTGARGSLVMDSPRFLYPIGDDKTQTRGLKILHEIGASGYRLISRPSQ